LQPGPDAGVDNQIAGLAAAGFNYGTEPFLCVGNDAANSERVLIHFDLSQLGSRATVTSCFLTFTVNQLTAPTSGRILRLRRNGWSESGSNWTVYQPMTPWGALGASDPATDVDETSAVPFAPPTVVGLFSFPSVQAFCQDAVTQRAGSLDLLIRQDVDQEGACTGSCVAHDFCSRSSDWGTPTDRPSLVVGYTPGASTNTTTTTSSTTTLPCTTAVCALEQALHGGACADQTVPLAIQNRLLKAAGAIDRAGTGALKTEKHRRKRAFALLMHAAQAAERDAKERHAKLSSACASSLHLTAEGLRREFGS
jgi:hypothetical protein